MRCDVCHRIARSHYAHREYNCANWPETSLDKLTTEYLGYTIMYVGGDLPYEIYKGDVRVSSEFSSTNAYMFIERYEDELASNRA